LFLLSQVISTSLAGKSQFRATQSTVEKLKQIDPQRFGYIMRPALQWTITAASNQQTQICVPMNLPFHFLHFYIPPKQLVIATFAHSTHAVIRRMSLFAQGMNKLNYSR
jgi:hypothetical protein